MKKTCYLSHCQEPVLAKRAPTPAEKKWMADLEKVLKAAPPGIGLATSGDASLEVYRAQDGYDNGIEHLYDGGIGIHGLSLGSVSSACSIIGISN